MDIEDLRRTFENRKASQARPVMSKSTVSKGPLRYLLRAANKLQSSLQKFQSQFKPSPLLIIVLDEISSLLADRNSTINRCVALHRVISCLKDHSMWFFMVFTDSKVDLIHPLDIIERDGNPIVDPSLLVVSCIVGKPAVLKWFPPFIALQLDVEYRRTQNAQKFFGGFSARAHMAMFGRRLWCAYNDPEEMHDVAKAKLIGGCH